MQAVLADVAQMTGIATIAMMATSKYVFRWGGWATAALATPIAIMISGAIFFGSALAAQHPGVLSPEATAALISVGAVAGVAGRVMSRAPKYSLMDPAKEMVRAMCIYPQCTKAQR